MQILGFQTKFKLENYMMDISPTISIIMNCLNCEKDLPAALQSVRAQTLQDYEIIFWDNGSSDKSAEIARNFGPKLRYFSGKETVSLGAARNLALQKARGEFIAFLDCDDLWKPEKLEQQVNLFKSNPGLGLVCTDTEIFDGNRTLSRLFETASPKRGHAFEALMRSQWISMSSAMIRKEALESVAAGENLWFDENLEVCEEADLFYRIAHDWEIDHVDQPLTAWRVHGTNTTFRKFRQFADETLLILEKHKKIYPDYEKKYPQLVEVLTNRAIFQKAVSLWRENKGKDARELLHSLSSAGPKIRLFWAASFLPGSFFDIAAKLYFALPGFLRK